jgi:hypothetical protein
MSVIIYLPVQQLWSTDCVLDEVKGKIWHGWSNDAETMNAALN